MESSLQCPRCGCKQSKVLETREMTVRGIFIKMRVRQCRYCSKQFKSKETTDQDLIFPSESRSKERKEKEEEKQKTLYEEFPFINPKEDDSPPPPSLF